MGVSTGIMTIGGGLLQANSQYQAGRQNQALAKYNAKVADLQAKDALSRGRESERRLRTQTRQQIGSQRASLAAQGIEVNEGTAADIQDDTAYFGELDALTIRNNAALEAWGYRTQRVNHQMSGEMAMARGRNNAYGTLLTTGGQAASQYARGGANEEA